MNLVQKLSCIQMISGAPERTAHFYEAAFGFVRTNDVSIADPALAKLMDIPGATVRILALRLGDQVVELADIHPRGRCYPDDVPGYSPLFQHFAIVVGDMTKAYARLSRQAGWTAISTEGPQQLPASSGGVTVYKFRDPEGHPLELLAFATGATPERWNAGSTHECLGIDHSAISVANTTGSIAFYERLGLRRSGGSLNAGPDQDKLDGVHGARVEVTALAPPSCATPHVELLCYRGDFDRNSTPVGINDIAATRLVFSVESAELLAAVCARHSDALAAGPARFGDDMCRAMLRDPDGHLLLLEAPA